MVAVSHRLRLILFVFIAALFAVSPVNAQVVISQVYGGGGNSGAPLKNDFIEIFNRGNADVSIAGWSVQYASAAGTSWAVTNLSGILQAGHYYLVQEAAGANLNATPLPTPDASGNIAMSATNAKVALVNSTIALGGACPSSSSIVDLIGFGTGSSAPSCFEGSPAPTLSNTLADLRANSGCTDTNNNAADFATAAPNPRNSGSSHACIAPLSIATASPLANGIANQFYSVTLSASGGTAPYAFSLGSGSSFPPGLGFSDPTLSGTLATVGTFTFTMQVMDSIGAIVRKDFQLTVTPTPTCTPTNSIAQIQGSGNTSPLAGAAVTASGVVTGRKSNGFFMQMPSPGDGDPSTSDGVFVFTSSTPTVNASIGNEVCVSGKVQEFIPSSDPTSPSQTEISSVTSIFAISTGNALPAPVVLNTFDTNPMGDLLQLEKYEAMRVQVDSLTVVAPTRGTVNEANATSTSAGIFYGVITGVARPFREPGVELPDALPAGSPCCVQRWDTNPEVVSVNSLGQSGGTALDVATGQVVTNVVGPIEFIQRAFTIDTDPATPPLASASLSYTPVSAIATDHELSVASFNVERFFDTKDDPGISDVALTAAAFSNRLNKASLAIRNVLRYPDVIGVEEMENLTTLQALANKVNNDALTAGDSNPNYQAYLTEGNDIGGIDVGLLVKTPKVNVIDVVQYGKDTMFTEPGGSSAILNDRPPLVLRATVQALDSTASLPVTLIVNHLRSLSGIDDPADGARVRAKREAQAEDLANLIQGFQTQDPSTNVISVGDYNAFQFSDGYVDVIGVVKGSPVPANTVVTPPATITDPQLTDLIDTVSSDQRYSYSFNGNAQEIDHVLVNPNALRYFSRLEYGRMDADFPEVYRNDANRPERISDHDPVVAYFNLPTPFTFNTSPAGLNFSVDGVSYSAAQTFQFIPGSSHELSTTALQAGTPGTQYVFSSWSDGQGLTHSITAPNTGTTYTANFTTQYQLTTAVGTPSGSVAPGSGNYFDAGSAIPVQATANAGYVFDSWTGPVASSSSASTTVTMSGPTSVTANFKPGPTSLGGTLLAKNGEVNGQTWTIQVTNSGPGIALGAKFDSFTFTQTSGPSCTPQLLTPLPISLGDLVAGDSATVNLLFDFRGCGAVSRFTVTARFSANQGAAGGSTVLTNMGWIDPPNGKIAPHK